MKVTQTYRCIRAFCGKPVQFDGDVCVDCKRKHAKKLNAQARRSGTARRASRQEG